MASSWLSADGNSTSSGEPSPAADSYTKISPSIALLIAVIAFAFFICAFFQLLLRRCRAGRGSPDDDGGTTALQGPLGQLFHLHDAGVNQAFIDALPVFAYREIVGAKGAFDCVVCLSEFEPDDRLRLLPMCSHAFHVDCIDTWLLSHSTCPLCRRSIIADQLTAPQVPSGSRRVAGPAVVVLGSIGDSERAAGGGGTDELARSASAGSLTADVESAASEVEKTMVQVKLGKLRSLDCCADDNAAQGTTSSGSVNAAKRRCLSMGSYEYVMEEGSSLCVAIRPPKMKRTLSNIAAKAMPKSSRHRHAASELADWSSMPTAAPLRPLEAPRMTSSGAGVGAGDLRKKDSYSTSKIWLASVKKDNRVDDDCSSARRAMSFRLPVCPANWDVESCCDSTAAPSLGRKTLLWVVGRASRVGIHG